MKRIKYPWVTVSYDGVIEMHHQADRPWTIEESEEYFGEMFPGIIVINMRFPDKTPMMMMFDVDTDRGVMHVEVKWYEEEQAEDD